MMDECRRFMRTCLYVVKTKPDQVHLSSLISKPDQIERCVQQRTQANGSMAEGSIVLAWGLLFLVILMAT